LSPRSTLSPYTTLFRSKTEEEVLDLMAERGVADDDSEHGFREVSLQGYLGHLDRGLTAVDERPQVAVVVAEGEIVGGVQPPGRIDRKSTRLNSSHVKIS